MPRGARRAGVVGVLVAATVLAAATPVLAGHPTWVGGSGDTGPDNDPDRFTVSEGDGSITIAFTVPMDPTHKAVWWTEADTATDGDDFIGASGVWPAEGVEGDQGPAVTVRLVDDVVSELPEGFAVLIWMEGGPDGKATRPADGSACIQDGWCDYAFVNIRDDDPALAQPASAAPRADPPRSSSPSRDAAVAAPTAGTAGVASPPPRGSPRRHAEALIATRDAIEPGPGFELLGERLHLDRVGGATTGDRDGNGAAPLAAFGAAVAGGAWGIRSWRRRWAW